MEQFEKMGRASQRTVVLKGSQACRFTRGGVSIKEFEKLPHTDQYRSKELLSAYLQGLLDVDY